MSLKEPTDEELKNLDKILLETNKRDKNADFAKAYGAKIEQSILDKLTLDIGVPAEAFSNFSQAVGAAATNFAELKEAMDKIPKIDFSEIEMKVFELETEEAFRNALLGGYSIGSSNRWDDFDLPPIFREKEDLDYVKPSVFRVFEHQWMNVPMPKSSSMYVDVGGSSRPTPVEVLVLGTSNHGKMVAVNAEHPYLQLECEYEPDDFNPTLEANDEVSVGPQLLREKVAFTVDLRRRIAYPSTMPIDQVAELLKTHLETGRFW